MLQAIRTRIHPCSTFLRSTYPSARSYRLPSPSLIIIKSGSKSLGPFRPVPATDPIHNCRVGMTLNHRRPHSTSEKHKERESTVHKNGRTDGNDHTHDHTHSHSFPFFGHSHSHQEGHARDAEKIIEALKGTGDRGSYITLVGLFTNVALTAAKGFAGWYLHSASLFADAGHSLSDLLGDFVTLFCWRLSRKPPSAHYPYGFAKFESFGTATISILLIGGALGIGFHSYHLLIHALTETVQTIPPNSALHHILQAITETAPLLPQIGNGHVHAVDPNAAWFAAVSVLSKEWLYRVTKVVADQEKSPVLLANAIHHRSDAYSSLVAFFAILGTWFFPTIPLDPLGGLLVSIVILQQGFGLFGGALKDLSDRGVSPRTFQSLLKSLEPLIRPPASAPSPNGNSHSALLSISSLRARRAGSLMFVDLTATVPGSVTVNETIELEKKIQDTLKKARNEIKEVRVSFRPV